MVSQGQSVAESARRRVRRVFGEVATVAAARRGKPADALVRYAETIDADLIVVGNKRVQGLSRLLGSVAHDVTAQAHCDVYVAHTHTS